MTKHTCSNCGEEFDCPVETHGDTPDHDCLWHQLNEKCEEIIKKKLEKEAKQN